jgi:hypothetical protein
MYQSLMLGALVGMSLTPRAVAGVGATATDSGPTKGNAGSVVQVQASPSRASAAAAAAAASSDADVMRVIRKASIEKAIDLTFWW